MRTLFAILLCAVSLAAQLPTLPQPPAEALDAAAAERPALLTTGLKLKWRAEDAAAALPAAGRVDPGRAAWAHTLPLYAPCGSGVRPMMWVDRHPQLGTFWTVLVDPLGLPRVEGEVVEGERHWFIVSLGPPRNEDEPVHVFPDGCALRFDLASPAVLVWQLAPGVPHTDALVTWDGSRAWLGMNLPDTPLLAGQRVWLQTITFDGSRFRFSQLAEVVFGGPLPTVTPKTLPG